MGLISWEKRTRAAACLSSSNLEGSRNYWETVTECSIRHSFLDVEYDIPID